MNAKRRWILVVVVGLVASSAYSEPPKGGKAVEPDMARLNLRIVEQGKSEPIPARVKIRDREGFLYRPKDAPAYRMSFVCRGETSLDLPSGRYSLEISRGPEYALAEKGFSLNKDQTVTVELDRWIHMAQLGWWSGEFHIHRPLDQVDDMILAEDLNVGVVQTIWNDRDLWDGGAPPGPAVRMADETHVSDILSTEDERGAGAVLLLNLKEPLRLPPYGNWYPTNIDLCRRAKEMGGWVDIEKPFWWGSPVVAALGLADSVGITNNHLTEISVWDYPAWGRGRDSYYADGPRGFWEYVCGIWYHLLNCGYRLPASAGSASGVLPNPVGFNRCYVHLNGPFSYTQWLEGLKAGRSFVTNGPMMFVKVAEKEPGETVELPVGEAVDVSVEIRCTEPVSDV
ncbi:MAG: CehA/McbA family metallohydrolase, partial [bacterium]